MGPLILVYPAWLTTYRLLCAMQPHKSTHEPSTQDENLAHETEKMFAVQICWGCFVAEVWEWLMPMSVAWGESSSHLLGNVDKKFEAKIQYCGL